MPCTLGTQPSARSGLRRVGGQLDLSDTGITVLSGLEALTAIGRSVRITNNDTLTSIGALQSLDEVQGTQFNVSVNPMLPVCDAKVVHDVLSVQPSNVDYTTGNLDDTPCL